MAAFWPPAWGIALGLWLFAAPVLAAAPPVTAGVMPSWPAPPVAPYTFQFRPTLPRVMTRLPAAAGGDTGCATQRVTTPAGRRTEERACPADPTALEEIY